VVLDWRLLPSQLRMGNAGMYGPVDALVGPSEDSNPK